MDLSTGGEPASTCYQVAAIVLLESARRAIGYKTACYQILFTGSESPYFRDFSMPADPVTL
jgi:hypothetical protein